MYKQTTVHPNLTQRSIFIFLLSAAKYVVLRDIVKGKSPREKLKTINHYGHRINTITFGVFKNSKGKVEVFPLEFVLRDSLVNVQSFGSGQMVVTTSQINASITPEQEEFELALYAVCNGTRVRDTLIYTFNLLK